MQHTLENHRSFPYIAWIVVIGFALLALYLTNMLREETGGLESNRSSTEHAIEQDLERERLKL